MATCCGHCKRQQVTLVTPNGAIQDLIMLVTPSILLPLLKKMG